MAKMRDSFKIPPIFTIVSAQILREINFGECKSSKNAIFAISGALNFWFG